MTDEDGVTVDRLTTFTDGVVAIAVTLLILPLAGIEPADGEGALEVLRSNATPIGAFLLSFVVIASYWSRHHEMFRSVRRHNARLVHLNTLWLASIVWLPFPTALISRHLQDGFGTLYVGSLLVVSLLTLALVLYLDRHAELLTVAGVSAFHQYRTVSVAPVLAMAAALTISLFSQHYGIWALLLMVPAQLIANGMVRRRSAPARNR
jgi:uncharacterized membrane protein